MYIIFDYDGTLHDTMIIYEPAFRAAEKHLLEIGKPLKKEFTAKDISDNLGRTFKEMWDKTAPDLDSETKYTLSKIIELKMNEMILQGQAKLYDGIKEVLEELSKKHTLIFLSNCRTSYKDMHRELFHLDDYFKAYYWAQKYPDTTKYEIFSQYIKKDFGEQSYIMVGDRFHDIEVATKNAIHSIGCLYGFAREHELDNATYFANKPKDILKIIESIENK